MKKPQEFSLSDHAIPLQLAIKRGVLCFHVQASQSNGRRPLKQSVLNFFICHRTEKLNEDVSLGDICLGQENDIIFKLKIASQAHYICYKRPAQ